MTVTITSSDGLSHGSGTIRIVAVGGNGPTFEDGTRTKEVQCPSTTKHTLKGGGTPGQYDVVFSHDGEEEVCGHICVFPEPSPDSGFKNIPEFKHPHGMNPEKSAAGKTAFDTASQAGQSLMPPVDPLPYGDIKCAVGDGNEIGGKIPQTPYNYYKEGGNVTSFIYEGEDSDLPRDYPESQRGHRFASAYDDCGNRIELFCDGDHYVLYFVDCNNNYYPIGLCLFPQAENKFKVNYTEQCGKKRFGIIVMRNLNKGDPALGNENYYRFDTCKKERIAAQMPSGVPIEGIPSETVAPVQGPAGRPKP